MPRSMRLCARLGLAAFLAVAGCQRHTTAPREPRARFAASSLAEEDVGASLLASVDNARLAIARNDRLDAANDVADALTFATQLAGQSSNLFLDAPPLSDGAPAQGSAHGGGARMTRFEAQVRLTSASAALTNGDLRTADTNLAAIQGAEPPRNIPANLPLLEADESLDLAIGALLGERPANLRYQLSNAVRALGAYQGAAHAADARALAAEIKAALNEPGGLDRVSAAEAQAWSDRIDGWI